MPVTKKKGTLFAIYADTPDKSSSSASSSSSSSLSSKPAKTVPTSPSKRTSSGSRKALGSLQPKAIDRSTSSTSSISKGKVIDSDNAKSRDLPPKSKPIDVAHKSQKLSHHSQSVSAPNKTRTKSSLAIFNDENSTSTKSTSTSTSTSRKLPIPTTSLKPFSSFASASSPKTRRSAPTPLAPSHNQPTKRTRDLLSPLPIIDHPSNPTSRASPRAKESIENRLDDPSESPLKRNKLTPTTHVPTSTSISTPSRVRRVQVNNGSDEKDKENIPLPIFSPEGDSPASRTRSKIRALTLSSGHSPLSTGRTATGSNRAQAQARREVDRFGNLIGDGRHAFTLKKGREVSGLLQEDLHETLENSIKALQPSPTKKSGRGKATATASAIKEIEMLGDVSEAYGAVRGNEPEGFKTQRVSFNLLVHFLCPSTCHSSGGRDE
ncbi:uncharacterized protein I303_103834 [Kwoniella dejecticola CBS 10117]|uniref:Uncharacterized protein n=1 Tax=Kwoniella dejecticola CBS 10117 TaxID=1296121 RepID=A0A1A6A7U8_9TREE|nr:uncharacterized protein I303_03853 [Kwoniella dejecticola CBS 10117]OBR86133.1 hypothetical protein I303_03853 [Kwoniella dejecticola CBS 10117]